MKSCKTKHSTSQSIVSSYAPTVQVTVSGAGVIHVDSASLLKTEQAQRQLSALKQLKEKNIFISK